MVSAGSNPAHVIFWHSFHLVYAVLYSSIALVHMYWNTELWCSCGKWRFESGILYFSILTPPPLISVISQYYYMFSEPCSCGCHRFESDSCHFSILFPPFSLSFNLLCDWIKRCCFRRGVPAFSMHVLICWAMLLMCSMQDWVRLMWFHERVLYLSLWCFLSSMFWYVESLCS